MLARTPPTSRVAARVTRSARQAFTLMEVLIVVAIIVVLAGIGGYYLLPQLDKSKEKAAKAQAIEVEKAVLTYYTDHSQYPANLQVLTQPSGDGGKPYISEDGIKDPWGQVYSLNAQGPNNKGAKPDIYTTSPSGKMIGNWGR